MKKSKKVLSLSLIGCLLVQQSPLISLAVTMDQRNVSEQASEGTNKSLEKIKTKNTIENSIEAQSTEKKETLTEETVSTESQTEATQASELKNDEIITVSETDVTEKNSFESDSKNSETESVTTVDKKVKDKNGEEAQLTVNFIVDGNIFNSQEINKGSIPQPPKLPTSSGAVVFVGWYQKNGDKKELYNFTKPLTKDTELYAEFREQYTIMFKVDNQIVETIQLNPKTAIEKPSSKELDQAVENASGGNVFSYWYDESDPEEKQIVFGVDKVTSDMVLVPKYSDRYTITYITNGEPLVNTDGTMFENPQFLDRGGKIAKPPVDPKRQGYTFKYWALDQSGNRPFDFKNQGKINENTVLYAIYEAAKGVSFFIQYWNEKSDVKGDAETDHSNYDAKDKVYVPYIEQEWPTGIAPHPDETLELPQTIIKNHLSKNTNRILDSTASEFSHYESQVLSSTGDTVINVFYKRVPQKLNFIAKGGWFQEKKYQLTLISNGKKVLLDGNKPAQSKFTLKAKVGEKLNDIWPEVENKEVKKNGAKQTFHGWSPNFENSIWVTKKARMEKSFSDGNLYIETEDAQNQVMPLHYMRSVDPSEELPEGTLTETYNGVIYTPIKELTEKLAKNVIQSLNAKNIPGYQAVSNRANISADKTYMRFLYNTNTVTLSKGFESDYTNEKIQTVVKPTGAKLTEKDLQALPNIPGKEFDGWYWDNDFKPGTEVRVGDLMPSEDTRIYVKWKSIQKYKVSYYRLDSDEKPLREEYYNDGDFTKGVSGYEQGKPDPEGKLGSFVGWFYEVSPGLWMPFKQSIPIYSDYKIVARWQVNNLHLKYDAHESAGGSWKNNSAFEDENNYTLGVDAIVSKTAHTQLLPPSGMTFSGWRLGYDGDMYYPGNPITMMGNQTLVADYTKKDAKKLIINVYQDKKNKTKPQTIVLTEDRKTALPMTWLGEIAEENKNRDLRYWLGSDGQKYHLGETINANDFLNEGITELDLFGYWEGVLKLDAFGLNEYSFKLGEDGFEDLAPTSASTTLKITDSRQDPTDWSVTVHSSGFVPKVSPNNLSLFFGKNKQPITNESSVYSTGRGDKELSGDNIHLFLNENYKDWISSLPYRATLNWSIESQEVKDYVSNPGVGLPKKVGDDGE